MLGLLKSELVQFSHLSDFEVISCHETIDEPNETYRDIGADITELSAVSRQLIKTAYG